MMIHLRHDGRLIVGVYRGDGLWDQNTLTLLDFIKRFRDPFFAKQN